MFKMVCSILAIVFLTMILNGPCFGTPGYSSSIAHINSIAITGLKNMDLKKNGKTDPYIKIYFKKKDTDDKILWKNKWEFPAIILPVKSDMLNPLWDCRINKGFLQSQDILIEVWDKDPVVDKFIGITELFIGSDLRGKTSDLNLQLFGRSKLSHPGIPNKVKKQGTLNIKLKVEEISYKRVPFIIGKSSEEAKSIAKTSGFGFWERSFLTEDSSLFGKVVSQDPESGHEVKCWDKYCGSISYEIGLRPTYVVPSVVGKLLWQAKNILSPFGNIQVKGRKGIIDTNEWFKVGAQDSVGKRVYRDAKITLFMNLPPDDFKFTVPNVTGKKSNDAVRALRNAHLGNYRILRYRTAVKEENGIILEQDPKGGEEVGIVAAKENSYSTWTTEKPVSIKLGWYADGKSLYSASPIGFDKDIEFAFNESGVGRFYIFDIKENGYLITENKKSVSGITPEAEYYMLENGKYIKKNWYSTQLPTSFRVIPGKWVVSLFPEMSESKSDEKSLFAFHFIKEFDDGEPNESFEQAVNVPIFSDIIVGSIGGSRGRDDVDFYTFKTEVPGYMEVTFKKLPLTTPFYGNVSALDFEFNIYDSSQKNLGLYYFPSVPKFLIPGKYFLKFQAKNGWTNVSYKFSLNFHKAEDLGEPNDALGTAYKVDVPAVIPVAYTSRGDVDYYMLSSEKPGYAVLSHDKDLPFDTNFSYYAENGTTQGSTLDLPAAVYIDKTKMVRVKAVTESNQYVIKDIPNLHIDFIPATEDKYEPNDDFKTAANIQINKKIKALLMPRNDVDNYAFSVERPGKIRIKISSPCGIPVKGKILLNDGTIFKNNVYFPYKAHMMKGDYILQFYQEGGFNKFCGEKYKLKISEFKKTKNKRKR